MTDRIVETRTVYATPPPLAPVVFAPVAPTTVLLAGLSCDHARMTECHPGCGHFSCPCGITWDEGAEGAWDDEDEERRA